MQLSQREKNNLHNYSELLKLKMEIADNMSSAAKAEIFSREFLALTASTTTDLAIVLAQMHICLLENVKENIPAEFAEKQQTKILSDVIFLHKKYQDQIMNVAKEKTRDLRYAMQLIREIESDKGADSAEYANANAKLMQAIKDVGPEWFNFEITRLSIDSISDDKVEEYKQEKIKTETEIEKEIRITKYDNLANKLLEILENETRK